MPRLGQEDADGCDVAAKRDEGIGGDRVELAAQVPAREQLPYRACGELEVP